MPLFTSDKERTLWLWTLAVLVAIYSTLGVARILVDVLEERNLLEAAVSIIALLVVGTIMWRWTKRRPGWREVAVMLSVGFAYWMVWVRIQNWAVCAHLIEYGIVAALIHQALLERERNSQHIPIPVATLGRTSTARFTSRMVGAGE